MHELSPRRQSAEILNHAEAYDVAKTLAEAATIEDTTEALEYIKPLHYAKLAQTIDLLMGDMLARRESRLPTGLLVSEYEQETLWQQVRSDSMTTVVDSTERISSTTIFRDTESMAYFIGTRDPNRFIDLRVQLMAGMDTAATSMLTFIRNIPEIAYYHDLATDRESLIETARNSVGLPGRMAMTCVDRMMGAQSALTDRERQETWADIEPGINPVHFKTRTLSNGSTAIQYAHFLGLEVPEGYEIGPERTPVAVRTKLGELACYQPTTIGCPITLLEDRMQELWNWYIDIVDEQDLWDVP